MLDFNLDVSFKNNSIDTNLKDLVQYDYNITLNFTFDLVGLRYVFKLLNPDNHTTTIFDIANNQITFLPGILNEEGFYRYEISMYNEDSKLTNYAKGVFYVRKALVNGNDVIEADDRLPILDTLINETDHLNLDVDKNNNTTTVTITKKDGTTKSVEIEDGQDGLPGRDGTDGQNGITPTIGDNGNWYIGDTDTGQTSRGTQGLPGPPGQDGMPGRDGAIHYTEGNNVTIDENNVISVDLTDYPAKGDVLLKNNTTSYTPTTDYDPATKKYVDDRIWVGTQEEYDDLPSYSETVIYFIKEDTNVSA